MAFAALDDVAGPSLAKTSARQRHAVIQLHTFADFAGFADDHAGAVVYEKMRAIFAPG